MGSIENALSADSTWVGELQRDGVIPDSAKTDRARRMTVREEGGFVGSESLSVDMVRRGPT